MDTSSVPKINYDDFYKFVASFGVLLLIIFSAFYFYLYSQGKFDNENLTIFRIPMVFSIFLILVISFLWYKNKQEVLDNKEKLLVNRIKIENEILDCYKGRLMKICILEEELYKLKKLVDEMYFNKKTIKQDWKLMEEDNKNDE